jgi:hypothetical protein
MKNKKQTKKEQKTEAAIIEQLIDSIRFIDNNMGYLKKLDSSDRYPIESAANELGYSLVKTNNLNEFYLTQEFCNTNNFEFIGTFY